VPIQIESRFARFALPVLWFLASHVLTIRTPFGRKLKRHVLANGSSRIRVKSKDLDEAGVVLAPKTSAVRDGRPVLEDGRILDVANVIWATGFRQDFSWIDVPVFDGDGDPVHERGAAGEPGLYFVGLDFMYAFTSENVGGVGRDARYVAKHIARLSSRRGS
jgi:putative flavoprotein involved in K+ transport